MLWLFLSLNLAIGLLVLAFRVYPAWPKWAEAIDECLNDLADMRQHRMYFSMFLICVFHCVFHAVFALLWPLLLLITSKKINEKIEDEKRILEEFD